MTALDAPPFAVPTAGSTTTCPPARASGVELVGAFPAPGDREPCYLVRIGTQWFQLTSILYYLLSLLDGEKSYEHLAELVSAHVRLALEAEDIEFLVCEKLLPLGLLAGSESPQPPDTALGLRVRRQFLPPVAVRVLATILHPLFYWPVVLVTLAVFADYDVVLFRGRALRSAAEDLLTRPVNALFVFGLLAGAAFTHELGHAAACRHGGARPGGIGGGIYLLWPVLYTDVSDACRLTRSGRLRTDLGGVYFNAACAVGFMEAWDRTHWMPLVVAAFAMNLFIVEQLLPLLRFDGYWIVGDLAGLPDPFPRLGPALQHLVGHVVLRRPCTPVIDGLKPHARRLVIVWALVTVVVLPLEFLLMLMVLPSFAVTSVLTAGVDLHSLLSAAQRDAVAAASLGAIDTLFVAVFATSLLYSLIFVGRRVGRAVLGHEGLRAPRVAAAALLFVLSAGVVSYSATAVHILRPPTATATR